jgi:hypothetical protein
VGKTMVKQLNKPTLYGNCGKTTYKYLWWFGAGWFKLLFYPH